MLRRPDRRAPRAPEPAAETTAPTAVPAVVPVAVVGGLVVAGLLGVAVAAAPVVGAWTSAVSGLLGALVCAAAARGCRGRMRLAWASLGAMLALYGAGDVLWLLFAEVEGAPPLLSLADALYLLALVPATVGLLAYPVVRGVTRHRWLVALDAAVLALALAVVTATLALDEVAALDASAWERVVLAVYPLTDGLLVALAVASTLRSVGAARLDVTLVGLAFATYLVADVGYARAVARDLDPTGTWVDGAYAAAPVALAVAALLALLTPTPARAARLDVRGLAASVLPDLSAVAALGLLLATGVDGAAARVAAVALLAALAVRQVAQSAAHRLLRSELEQRVAERGRELEDLAAQHRRLEDLKYGFVSSVSHELRTPLTAIRGSLELLRDGDGGELGPVARRVVDIAVRGSHRLGRLVEDIIDLERLESGAFAVTRQRCEVRSLAEEVVSGMAALAASHEVALEVVGDPGTVEADPDRVTQVLVNLLGNALRYAPASTVVRVEVAEEGEEVVTTVSDRGRGIPPDQLEAVFGRFHQAVPEDDTRRGGTGLGLAICRRIVEAHGGRIWAEEAAAGARLCFALPAVAAG